MLNNIQATTKLKLIINIGRIVISFWILQILTAVLYWYWYFGGLHIGVVLLSTTMFFFTATATQLMISNARDILNGPEALPPHVYYTDERETIEGEIGASGKYVTEKPLPKNMGDFDVGN